MPVVKLVVVDWGGALLKKCLASVAFKFWGSGE